MQVPPEPSTQPASAPGPGAATETVTRPEPGLARGRWEAPAWAFWIILAVVLASSTFYVLRRMGVLRLRSRAARSTPLREGKR